jgi:ribosome-associated protein
MAITTETDHQTIALLRSLVAAFEDKKAENLTVLDVSAQSNITDYLILATGNSEPHLRALRIEAEKVLDAAKITIAGMDQGGFGSGWTVVDAYQIMIHFFTAEQRENYALEKLWRDAEVVDVKEIVAKPKRIVKMKPEASSKTTPKAAKMTKKKAPAKKAPVKAVAPKKPAVKPKTSVKSAKPTKKGSVKKASK